MLAWQFGRPVRELQMQMGADEFALWPAYLEIRAMRRDGLWPPPEEAKDPKQVYEEFKAALFGSPGVINDGG